MVNVIPDEIHEVTRELLLSLRAYRKAKGDYADAYERVRTSRSWRTGGKARRDWDNAMSNGSWLQGEIAALGSALSGLCDSQRGEDRWT